MDIEKLVDIITKEVMNKLSFLENVRKEKLLLIGNVNEKIINSLGDTFSMVIIDSYDTEAIKNVNINEYKHIVISHFNNKEFVNISLGICSNSREDLIIKSVMLGKKIHFIEEGIEYKKYSDTCNSNLYKLYNDYECKIKSYGISVIKEEDLLDSLMNNLNNVEKIMNFNSNSISEEISMTNEEIYINDKKLISENDLRKLYRTGIKTINITKKCVITPLAQDFIRINRIKLNRI